MFAQLFHKIRIFIMKIVQLHIYLLMWSQVTESLTNIAVTLGADVNISCDLDIEEIYWYKHKSPDPPVLILRTFDSTYEGAEYENSIFEDKYSVKTNSRLFIRNITTDELGVYYCVKTSEPQKFSNSTKIYISDLVHRNQTESNGCPQHQKPWRNLTIITSVLLNVLMIIALIGLLKRNIKATGRSKNYTAAKNSNNLQVRYAFSNCCFIFFLKYPL
ncbi:Ig kappa chain V-III region [Labeo rohita]|uniref:Ig kappa chain V-III region n=1 Tax=Labeo rohita TaxID=84645 RepID=A0ABQ8L6D5_LABRO|nr:Ig kappa chain V-III region [Labeo rohita]